MSLFYEFDRAPVSRDRLLGPGYFAGSFAGEHVAATEFVIGASFVSWGAGIEDIFFGLAVGNLLAVLSWTLLCAPIAVETRLTLYWYLRKIGGPALTAIANLLNAVLYCILAGCMITVSASAVRIPFGIPAETQVYPDDWRFVAVVLSVGALVVWLAIAGFQRLAAFAMVCAPWMFLMFLAGAIAVIPKLGDASGVGPIDSFDAFWRMGRAVIWTGSKPDGGASLGFYHVAAFAWICNAAMHAGLSDMALLRYAKKARYGLFSFFGTFLGHYAAWIAAGVMGAGSALILGQALVEVDSGGVAFAALGWTGALAVVIAGWTTSNPTLYRAGLALQAVTPNGSRAKITLAVGIVTSLIACFPFVFTLLLDFVGLYGLVLSPAGAVVLTEHWIFPRVGLKRYWVSANGMKMNWPALGAWAGSVSLGLLLETTGVVHLFFLFLPVYLSTSLLYLVLAYVWGAGRGHESEATAEFEPASSGAVLASETAARSPLAWVAGLVALAALAACLILPIRVYLGGPAGFEVNHRTMKEWLIIPTLVYFVSGTLFLLMPRRSRHHPPGS